MLATFAPLKAEVPLPSGLLVYPSSDVLLQSEPHCQPATSTHPVIVHLTKRAEGPEEPLSPTLPFTLSSGPFWNHPHIVWQITQAKAETEKGQDRQEWESKFKTASAERARTRCYHICAFVSTDIACPGFQHLQSAFSKILTFTLTASTTGDDLSRKTHSGQVSVAQKGREESNSDKGLMGDSVDGIETRCLHSCQGQRRLCSSPLHF
ncbi:uncharacterized protein [Narcine bancroftii]|uniref:uncharacterized protein n=1 Tax=Narcine bancroftii TaxID=1343680 RepID=UPI003831BE74